ncbi:hypothetical protein KP509_30G073600 [Ceratopteris richardii]|uniref:Protein kinase domain-containing protein n=1 Tax=Ceratopteris richardii TaxID=49495 RepID=A0A8T2R3Q8_CERRI|nr:hypothetical protein KP509_30G073600 [Ceratopteris richardii]
MGNCLILFASDDSFNLLTRLHPFPCESSRTTRCLTTHEYAVDPSHRNLHFDPILPFSTPSDIVPLYELGSQLGRGEFGVVCKCTKRITGQIFACKSISKLQLSTSEETQNIVREATIMQLLSSHGPADGPNLPSGSNVVHLHDIVEDRTSVHLIMDLCSGGDLFDKIAKVKRFPEVQAAHVMKSLLEGLQYCHKKGIIHRDIKPENILLVDDSEQPTIKLADFGLALEFSPGQKFCGVAGSAYYMAPEVLDGEYSVEIDMWSSGVLMYVLLSGVPPFWGNTEQDIFNAIRNGSLDLNSGIWQLISPVAKDLISKMLCVDVKSRCTSSQALRFPDEGMLLHQFRVVRSIRECALIAGYV